MSNLDKHLQAKANRLSDLEATLRAIQEQLSLVQQELRVEHQLQKAQESVKKEFDAQKRAFKKLLKDACSCFEQDALDDFVSDLQELTAEVKAEYENHAASDRFINAESAEAEDETDELINPPYSGDLNSIPLLVEVVEELPPEQDDQTLLTPPQVAKLINDLDSGSLTKLQNLLGVNARIKAIHKVAEQIADTQVTRYKLQALIDAISSLTPRLTAVDSNGHSTDVEILS